MYKFKDFKELVELRKNALEHKDENLVAQYDQILKDNFNIKFQKNFILSVSDFNSLLNNLSYYGVYAQGVPIVDENNYFVIKNGCYVYSDCELRIKDKKGLKRYLLPINDKDNQLIQIPLFIEMDKLDKQWSDVISDNPKLVEVLWKIVKENFNTLNKEYRIIQKMISKNVNYIKQLADEDKVDRMINKAVKENENLNSQLEELRKL